MKRVLPSSPQLKHGISGGEFDNIFGVEVIVSTPTGNEQFYRLRVPSPYSRIYKERKRVLPPSPQLKHGISGGASSVIKLKVGIMGGTFDPIHLGHLAVAESVREIFQLDEILFIPAARPPHKLGKNITPELHRLMMTFLATKSNEHFRVSPMEILREGLSYTLRTVDELHERLGAETEIFFIIGADSLRDLPMWYQSRELVSKCHFIATTRPNVRVSFAELRKFFGKLYKEKIHKVTTPGIEISSTEIRRRVKEGLSIKYLVPEVVEEYITKERLYL